MRSFSPVHVKHLLENRFFGGADFKDICDEHIVVNKAEPYELEPTVLLPHQLENITRLHPETSKHAEDQRMHGGRGHHAPLEAFRISGVKFRDSGFYKRNWRFYFPQVAPPGEAVRAAGGSYALASSYSGIQYFGHWLRDDMTTFLLAEEFAKPFCVRIPDWPHPKQYLDTLDMAWPMIDFANLDELFFFLDYSQNSNKTARYRKMRERLRTKVTPKHDGHRVYLKRGATGAVKRIVTNEAEVLAALEKENFIIIDIVEDSLETVLSTLLNARVLITVEGSQTDHGLYSLAEGAGLLSIVSPNMFCNTPKDWTSVLNMKYGVVVGETDGGGFSVNVSDLLKTLEMLEAKL
ncbi:MAG: glycosyltransferase family 61 protein [Pseudomonadota bacterium]